MSILANGTIDKDLTFYAEFVREVTPVVYQRPIYWYVQPGWIRPWRPWHNRPRPGPPGPRPGPPGPRPGPPGPPGPRPGPPGPRPGPPGPIIRPAGSPVKKGIRSTSSSSSDSTEFIPKSLPTYTIGLETSNLDVEYQLFESNGNPKGEPTKIKLDDNNTFQANDTDVVAIFSPKLVVSSVKPIEISNLKTDRTPTLVVPLTSNDLIELAEVHTVRVSPTRGGKAEVVLTPSETYYLPDGKLWGTKGEIIRVEEGKSSPAAHGTQYAAGAVPETYYRLVGWRTSLVEKGGNTNTSNLLWWIIGIIAVLVILWYVKNRKQCKL